MKIEIIRHFANKTIEFLHLAYVFDSISWKSHNLNIEVEMHGKFEFQRFFAVLSALSIFIYNSAPVESEINFSTFSQLFRF